VTTSPWVRCSRCNHRRDMHGNTTTTSSECHAVGATGRGVKRCDCPAFAVDARTPGDVLGEIEGPIKSAIGAAIAEDLAADDD